MGLSPDGLVSLHGSCLAEQTALSELLLDCTLTRLLMLCFVLCLPVCVVSVFVMEI